MKKLKFNHPYVEDIKAGSKTATFRVNDDKDIQVGDRIAIVDKVKEDYPTTWEVPGEIQVESIEKRALGTLTKENFSSAESFDSVDEMLTVFKRFYGEHISEDTTVSIIFFRYIPYDNAEQYVDQIKHTDELRGLVHIYADGGSRGNPGPSAAGYVIMNEDEQLVHTDNKYLGLTTNNQAEYHAVILAMEWCLAHHVHDVDVRLDSMLVVNQLKGIFKVKNRDLWTLYETASELSRRFRSFKVTHVPRELNKLADAEVNKALDAVKGSDIVQ